MNGQSCENCRYFKKQAGCVVAGQMYDGTCRRYPPTWVEDGAVTITMPTVNTQWCGEWCPANPQTVSEGAAYLARLVILGDRTAAYALVDKLTEDKQEEATDGPTE